MSMLRAFFDVRARHSPKKGRLGRQLINQAPPEQVRAWGNSPRKVMLSPVTQIPASRYPCQAALTNYYQDTLDQHRDTYNTARLSSSLFNSFPCYLSIQPFCYVLFITIFYSKIVLLPLHQVVCMSSCILLLVVGRILFIYFGLSCFNCITWSCLGIF